MYQRSNVYTPQISPEAAFILRRIAWSLGKPMTSTLNNAILALVPKLNHTIICTACKDERCSVCPLLDVRLIASDSAVKTYSG